MKFITFRLKPGSDLKSGIETAVSKYSIRAGFIATCVGGLEQVTVRMAGATPDSQDIRTITGNFEIVSLVGTVSVNGIHLHLSFSDKEGAVRGGHLKAGAIVSPTAEIIIGIVEDATFTREMDDETGFKELVVKKRR